MDFGTIEHRIRRDIVNDNDPDCYRWSVAAVMSAMNKAVKDIPTRINGWAGVDERGRPIDRLETARIAALCDASSAEPTELEVAELRGIAMPLQERYAEAVAFLAAAYLLQTDESDSMNQQKAAEFMQKGKEEAMA